MDRKIEAEMESSAVGFTGSPGLEQTSDCNVQWEFIDTWYCVGVKTAITTIDTDKKMNFP